MARPGGDGNGAGAGPPAPEAGQGPPAPEAGQGPPGSAETTALSTIKGFGAVIGPTALITALLFYFGWARADSEARFLGLDVSLFGFSTQDYLLQSISSVVFPLGGILIAGLVLLWAHGELTRRIDGRPEATLWRWVAALLALAGIALFGTGLVWYYRVFPSDTVLLLTPLSLTLGVGMVSYAVLVLRRAAGGGGATSGKASSSGLPTLSVILVSTLLAVGLVWEVGNYAEIKGRQLGEFVADQLGFQPGVVVYSQKRLHIEAPGVEEKVFPEPESGYGFRYSGLKLLFRTDNRFFLVPASWSLDAGSTVVLPDNDSVRLEFARPTG